MKYLAAFQKREGVDVFAENNSLKKLMREVEELRVWDIDPDEKVYIYELKEVL